jgi:hypothetical protein
MTVTRSRNRDIDSDPPTVQAYRHDFDAIGDVG